MREVRWSGPAKEDIAQIGKRLVGDDGERLADLIDGLVAAADYLASAPKSGSLVGDTFERKWPVKGSPFLLFYQLRPDHLLVTRVAHAESDWKSRY